MLVQLRILFLMSCKLDFNSSLDLNGTSQVSQVQYHVQEKFDDVQRKPIVADNAPRERIELVCISCQKILNCWEHFLALPFSTNGPQFVYADETALS